MTAVKPKPARWPVVEIFGPTVQGEGVDQGVIAHFVRFGGCDFRCDWCDTPHAVLPAEVRDNAERLGPAAIAQRLAALDHNAGGQPPWVVLSGGNPALHDLSSLVNALQGAGYKVAVETQGSRWRDWMADVDRLCVSPKPPSAKQAYDWVNVQRFLEEGLRARATGEREYEWLFLKIVVFDVIDLDWAAGVRRQLSDALLYLSAGNDAGRTVGNPDRLDFREPRRVRSDLLKQYRWLVETVIADYPELYRDDVIMQAQAHVLLWGNEKGR